MYAITYDISCQYSHHTSIFSKSPQPFRVVILTQTIAKSNQTSSPPTFPFYQTWPLSRGRHGGGGGALRGEYRGRQALQAEHPLWPVRDGEVALIRGIGRPCCCLAKNRGMGAGCAAAFHADVQGSLSRERIRRSWRIDPVPAPIPRFFV